jgi:hypothetical protein
MEAVRKIVDGNRLNTLFALPKSFLGRKVEILVMPVAKKKAHPRVTKQALDKMLPGSITQALIGSLSGVDITVDVIRAERLRKYERVD